MANRGKSGLPVLRGSRARENRRKKLPQFAGTYELAAGQTRNVSIEGDHLIIERNGKRETLWPEASEIFFRKGVEGRILFRADDKGKIDALIDRRNNEDVVWRKVK